MAHLAALAPPALEEVGAGQHAAIVEETLDRAPIHYPLAPNHPRGRRVRGAPARPHTELRQVRRIGRVPQEPRVPERHSRVEGARPLEQLGRDVVDALLLRPLAPRGDGLGEQRVRPPVDEPLGRRHRVAPAARHGARHGARAQQRVKMPFGHLVQLANLRLLLGQPERRPAAKRARAHQPRAERARSLAELQVGQALLGALLPAPHRHPLLVRLHQRLEVVGDGRDAGVGQRGRHLPNCTGLGDERGASAAVAVVRGGESRVEDGRR